MAKTADWYYVRKNCTACNKVNAFMESHGLTAKEQVPASRKLQLDDAKEILQGKKRLYAIKGKNIEEFSLTGEPSEEALAASLGPTGNLRAPLLILGKTVVVGFDEKILESAFGL